MERIVDRDVISVTSRTDFKSVIRQLVHPYVYHKFATSVPKPVMTWAPSHIELGYLAEVLRYANIIDGLNEDIKRKLRIDLEYDRSIYSDEFLEGNYQPSNLDEINEALLSKRSLFCLEDADGQVELRFRGIELCMEYIDYLKEILKPYLGR